MALRHWVDAVGDLGPGGKRLFPGWERKRLPPVILLILAIIGVWHSDASAAGGATVPGEAAVLRQVSPAVVSISVWKVRSSDQPGEPHRRVKTYGSGFLVDPSGIIVTNQHVIDQAIDVKAVLADGTRTTAQVLAASPLTDLAVLKIDVGRPLPSLSWGDSDSLQVGDPVLTLGNGLGLANSVSAGIVSGLNRNFGDSPFDSYIQTDAVINHGNSGGPLIDHDGKVVGVSEALINPESQGGFIGVGLAIPSSIAKFVTTLLVAPDHRAPGSLGFNLQDLTPQLATILAAPRPTGAVISAVTPDGPASHASLQLGDVLDTFNGQPLDDSRAFMRAIAVQPPGTTVQLTFWRNGAKHDVSTSVVAWPNYKPNGGVMGQQVVAHMMTMPPDLGVKLASLDDAARKQYGIGSDLSGVLVSHVEADSEASDLGIREGDVVAIVQGVAVVTPDDVKRVVREAHDQHRTWLAVLIRSKNGAQWVPISVSAGAS